MTMLPKNYCHMMYCKFDDGEVMYYKPHSFSLLDMMSVNTLMRVSLPKDAIELRGSNLDCPNIYWGDYENGSKTLMSGEL